MHPSHLKVWCNFCCLAQALEKALQAFHTTKMADINKIIRELWQKTYRGQDIDYIKIVADAPEGMRSYNYRWVRIWCHSKACPLLAMCGLRIGVWCFNK